MSTFAATEAYKDRVQQQAQQAVVLTDTDLPEEVDLSADDGPVTNQYTEGSCTAETLAHNLLWWQRKLGYSPIVTPSVNASYYIGRLIYGDLLQDDGSTLLDTYLGAVRYGVWANQTDPYNLNTLYQKPPSGDAAFKAKTAQVAPATPLSIRQLLAAGNPPGIAFLVYESLFYPVAGVVRIRGSKKLDEGHAEFAVGYKPDAENPGKYLYKVEGSWGTDYGEAGYAWIDEDYLENALMEVCTIAIPEPTHQPTPEPVHQPTPAPQDLEVFLSGFDASSNQPSINFSEAALSQQFVILRSNIGRTSLDPTFASRYQDAADVGLVRGAYQVGYPIYDSALGSYHAYQKTVIENGGFELPPVLDLEKAGCGSLSSSAVQDWAVAWLTAAIADYGHAILYSDQAFFETCLDIANLPEGTILWVANYSESPTIPWTFWQVRDTGNIPGIVGPVDEDRFRGTLDDLTRLTKKYTPQPLHKEDEPMETVHIQINGQDVPVPGVMYDKNTCIPWTVLQTILPGIKAIEIDAKPFGTTYAFNFTYEKPSPVVDEEKPIKVTLTYADGKTQTIG